MSLDDRLDEEIRFHLDQQIEKLCREGLSPDEARRQALLKFGGREVTKERARDDLRPSIVDGLVRDLRHGVRVLWRAPGFTAAALVTLALGIGGTSAIVSVVRTVMLEPLPYREPERLVSVWEITPGGARNVISAANFVTWRERTRTLEHPGLLSAGPTRQTLTLHGHSEQVTGATLSSQVFHALGVQPVLGRAYTADEDRGTTVVLVSHELWQRRLGGRHDVLGLTLTLDGRRRTIIGVMPPGFTIVGQKAEFLIPYGLSTEQFRAQRGRGFSYGIARLRDGVSLADASREMRRLFAELQQEAPQRNAHWSIELVPLQEQMVGEIRPALFALLGAVGLVLLVACVNVANLLLARSAARARELGLRTALGARRQRLVRQMLTESLVLAIAGGVAGLAVAAWCHRGLLALVGDRLPIPRIDQVTLDLPVMAFTMITAVATGLLFGLVPAFVTTSQASDALREGGRHGGGRRLHRVLSALVVAEVALSLVLLAGAGLLMRSFLALQQVDPGFRADGVLTVSVALPATRYTPVQASGVFRDMLPRLAALPGVQHAAGTMCLPLTGPCVFTGYWRLDRPAPASGQEPSGQVRPVTPSFFETMGIPRRAGRDFAASDTAESPRVAIVSESLVRAQFGNADPLGRRIRIMLGPTGTIDCTIVGVVGDTKVMSLDEAVGPTIFLPMTQFPTGRMRFVLRTPGDPVSLASSVTRTVQAIDPEAPVEIRTLEEIIGRTIARPRAIAVLVGVFAIVALTLAAVGVYGVMAYSVRERTQEIGVRMALGASASSVLRLVIGQALRLVGIGVVVGLIAAGALTRLLARLLYGVAPLDPWTFVGTALILLTVAAIASYVPARRGMRMAPIDALRTN
jgi:putative ABC transport system permease protein